MKNILVILFLSIYCNIFPQDQQAIKNEVQYALIEASRLKLMGNLEEAVKIYKTCISSYPECAVAWFEIGSIYSASGLEKDAENFLKTSYLLDKDNYWYVIAYTDLLNKNGNYKEAINVLEKSLKNFPKEDILLKYRMAENYYDLKKHEKAIKIIDKLERKYGISQLLIARKIEIIKELGNDKKIKNEFIKIINHDPENLTFNIMYAEYLVEKNLINEAISKYEYILTIDEENIYAISNLTELYAKIEETEKSYEFLLRTFKSEEISLNKKIQTLSYLLADEGKIKNDSKYIEEIINYLNINESNNYDFLVVVYDFYYKINNLNEAYNVIKKITSLKNDNYIIWAQALYNGIQIEKYEDVIELGNNAVKIFPNKDDLKVFIALAYYNKKDYYNTYKVLSETGDNFTEPDIKKQKELLFAESAYKSGYIDESFKKFEKLILQDPDNLIIKNNYSYYLAIEEINLERAKELSYETILKEPESSTFLDTYAWILFKLKLYEKAEIYIRKAVELDESKSTEILEHMINILIKNEKYKEADQIKLKIKE